jgi:hypothetical protein
MSICIRLTACLGFLYSGYLIDDISRRASGRRAIVSDITEPMGTAEYRSTLLLLLARDAGEVG